MGRFNPTCITAQKASASSGLPVFEQARAAISTACKEKNMADAPFASLIKLLKDS